MRIATTVDEIELADERFDDRESVAERRGGQETKQASDRGEGDGRGEHRTQHKRQSDRQGAGSDCDHDETRRDAGTSARVRQVSLGARDFASTTTRLAPSRAKPSERDQFVSGATIAKDDQHTHQKQDDAAAVPARLVLVCTARAGAPRSRSARRTAP